MLTKKDIPQFTGRGDWTDAISHQGYSVRVQITHDEHMGAPWEEHDGHGPVSEWRRQNYRGRFDKQPGERLLHQDGRSALFYDFAAAVKLARKDGWDAPPYKTGTKGEQAVRAVEHDFQFLRRWCNNDWYWIVVTVEVSRAGRTIECYSCGGIESDGDYWREHAADSANAIIRADRKERRERKHWEARDVRTTQ